MRYHYNALSSQIRQSYVHSSCVFTVWQLTLQCSKETMIIWQTGDKLQYINTINIHLHQHKTAKNVLVYPNLIIHGWMLWFIFLVIPCIFQGSNWGKDQHLSSLISPICCSPYEVVTQHVGYLIYCHVTGGLQLASHVTVWLQIYYFFFLTENL